MIGNRNAAAGARLAPPQPEQAVILGSDHLEALAGGPPPQALKNVGGKDGEQQVLERHLWTPPAAEREVGE